MTVLVSPAEPKYIKSRINGVAHNMPEKYGADFLIVGDRGKLAIQRKKMPGDLIKSLRDSRLARLLIKMRKADYGVIVIEGWPRFTHDGEMVDQHLNWTRVQLRNLLRSIRLDGVWVERTDNEQDTVEAVHEYEEWFKKPVHRSINTRPKSAARGPWGTRRKKDWGRFLLQGFPGIGVTLAEDIYSHFNTVPLEWTVTKDEMMEVPGIGVKRAEKLWEMLEGEN